MSVSWTGTAPAYRVIVGSAANLSDVHTADVTGTTYTWTAPRDEALYYIRVVGVSGGQTSEPATEFPGVYD